MLPVISYVGSCINFLTNHEHPCNHPVTFDGLKPPRRYCGPFFQLQQLHSFQCFTPTNLASFRLTHFIEFVITLSYFSKWSTHWSCTCTLRRTMSPSTSSSPSFRKPPRSTPTTRRPSDGEHQYVAALETRCLIDDQVRDAERVGQACFHYRKTTHTQTAQRNCHLTNR